MFLPPKEEMRGTWLFVILSSFTLAQQKWYLTGKNFNDKREFIHYEPEVIDVWAFPNVHGVTGINFTHTSFGGALAKFIGHNATLPLDVNDLVTEIFRHHCPSTYHVDLLNVWVYNIYVTITQDAPLELEIGLYDHPTYAFSFRENPSHLLLGKHLSNMIFIKLC